MLAGGFVALERLYVQRNEIFDQGATALFKAFTAETVMCPNVQCVNVVSCGSATSQGRRPLLISSTRTALKRARVPTCVPARAAIPQPAPARTRDSLCATRDARPHSRTCAINHGTLPTHHQRDNPVTPVTRAKLAPVPIFFQI